jgi:hypothetical protein
LAKVPIIIVGKGQGSRETVIMVDPNAEPVWLRQLREEKDARLEAQIPPEKRGRFRLVMAVLQALDEQQRS